MYSITQISPIPMVHRISGVSEIPSIRPGLSLRVCTPDVIAGNNLIGSGSARVMQLGLKLKF